MTHPGPPVTLRLVPHPVEPTAVTVILPSFVPDWMMHHRPSRLVEMILQPKVGSSIRQTMSEPREPGNSGVA